MRVACLGGGGVIVEFLSTTRVSVGLGIRTYLTRNIKLQRPTPHPQPKQGPEAYIFGWGYSYVCEGKMVDIPWQW